jgi:hypothetical protein
MLPTAETKVTTMTLKGKKAESEIWWHKKITDIFRTPGIQI